jgi:hypothetical protein
MAALSSNHSQSNGLRSRLSNMMYGDGRHMTDDSKKSEKVLQEAMKDIIVYAENRFKSISQGIAYKNKITLYECQQYFANIGGPQANPQNKNVYMKPDGGILFALMDGKEVPILITYNL